MTANIQTIKDYFAAKAPAYDDTDLQPYWVFSDDILWEMLKKLVLPENREQEFVLLDAGAGTGRWSKRVLEAYPRSKAILIDISPDMLGVAKNKFEKSGLSERASFHIGNVEEMAGIADNVADFSFCFHNVTGFLNDPSALTAQLHKKLSPGGTAVVMYPNYYHAMYFSNATRRLEELERIKEESAVRFTPEMPSMKVFRPDNIEKLMAGFKKTSLYGFPVSLYPGSQETQLHGSTGKLVEILEEPAYRKFLMEMELECCLDPQCAARGNNLLSVSTK